MTASRGLILGVVLAVAGCDRQPPSQDAPGEIRPAEAASVAETPPPPPSPPPAYSAATDQPPQHLTQQPPMQIQPARVDKPRRTTIYTPPPGSSERVALMNALRDAVRHDLGGDPVFVVRDLRSNGDWAFGVLEPTWPGGRRIAPEQTPLYQRSADRDGLDGLRTEAIWRKANGRWQVQAHNIGATDVWWSGHCDAMPFGLLPGC